MLRMYCCYVLSLRQTHLLLLKKSLNLIYFTSITLKAHGTYIRFLEGVNVTNVWSN